jgi:hypothetical protein
MKARIYKLIAGTLILLASLPVIAGEHELSETIEKQYKASQETNLALDNKYGNIDVFNWTKDEIHIKVTIEVESHSEESARRMLEDIDVEFSHDGNDIRAKTVFADNFMGGGIFNIFGGNGEFDIHYEVNIPEYIDLAVHNKYGDVFVNRLDGHAFFDVKYGNLRVNTLTRGNEKPHNEINLAYSEGTVKACEWGRLDIKYSEVEIEKSKALIVYSRYSELSLEEGSSVVIDSKYDEYALGEFTNLVGEAAYTEFEVEELTKSLDLDIKYTDVEVESVPAGFEKIKIDSQYGDIEIGIAQGASYSLFAELDYCDIDYPRTGPVNHVEDGSSTEISGIVGNGKNPSSKVFIESKYGDVDLTD